MLSPVTRRGKTACRLQDSFGALSPPLPSLVPATPPSRHPSLLHAPRYSSLTLLPAAFQLIAPCKRPVNHPCTCISLSLEEREFIPLAQLSERPPAARSDQHALNSWQGCVGPPVKAPVPASLPNLASTAVGACLHPGHGNCLGKIPQHELIAVVLNDGKQLGAPVREQRDRRGLQEGVAGWEPHACSGWWASTWWGLSLLLGES